VLALSAARAGSAGESGATCITILERLAAIESTGAARSSALRSDIVVLRDAPRRSATSGSPAAPPNGKAGVTTML
jgi:hypothetical protein